MTDDVNYIRAKVEGLEETCRRIETKLDHSLQDMEERVRTNEQAITRIKTWGSVIRPQHRALQEAVTADRRGQGPQLSDERGLRQEFTKASGDFVTVRDAFGKVQIAVTNPSAAGDLALIFNYMKILDPGSVVRESEFAQAAATGSFGERLKAAGQRLVAGERLSDAMRADFSQAARNQFISQLGFQFRNETEFRRIAEQSRIDPGRVIIDFVGPALRRLVQPDQAPSGGTRAAPTGDLQILGIERVR